MKSLLKRKLQKAGRLAGKNAVETKLRSALAKDGDNPALLLRLALLIFRGKDYKGACALLKKARKLGNTSFKLWRALGICHFMLWRKDELNNEHLQEAQAAYKHALETVEGMSNPRLLHEVAEVYKQFGAFKGSLSVLSKIVVSFSTYKGSSSVAFSEHTLNILL